MQKIFDSLRAKQIPRHAVGANAAKMGAMRPPILAFLLLLSVSAQHQEPEKKGKRHPAIGDPAAIEAGRKIFAAGCGGCHGAEGQGGRGPNLRRTGYWHATTAETLYRAIKQGIPAGGMPPSNLPEDQTWQVVAFVKSLTAPAFAMTVPGDVEAGKALFWGKGGCNECHRLQGRGGGLGPDLTNVGGRLSVADIRESMVDPDADGALGYRKITVKLKDGRTLTGAARNRSNYAIQLQDAQGVIHRIDVANVVEMDASVHSPMPRDYAQRLSRQEIQDLVAYLSRQSLRPASARQESEE